MRKLWVLLVILAILPAAFAETGTAEYLLNAVPDPCCGCEWVVLGLSRDGRAEDAWADAYRASLYETLRASDGDLGSKYTEYSRTALALLALGDDPADFRGYDLLKPLTDFEAVTRQGINGAVFALLALQMSDGPCCDQYVEYLLGKQLPDGGFALMGEHADADITAMVICALAGRDAEEAVDAALNCLSAMQKEDGGFASFGTPNAESCAQAVLALCGAGVSVQDARFVKNGCTAADAMEQYAIGDGSYSHTAGGEASVSATQQVYLAQVALEKGFVYDFSGEDAA